VIKDRKRLSERRSEVKEERKRVQRGSEGRD
jgi:hypothetical protein